ncbi:hypothetical protein MMC17_005883 [Xylographa soralifera]|nr:hypothetical protein [Xylographa soralifera]
MSASTRLRPLDALIHNAGAMPLREAFARDWDVNATGAHLLTEALVPFLLIADHPSRLLFLTSGTCSLAANERKPPYCDVEYRAPRPRNFASYRGCKAGLNMVMREWHRRLSEHGVLVWVVSPGFLATGLGGVGVARLREMGAVDAAVGGEVVRDVVEGKRDGDAGRAIRKDGVQPW